MNSRHPLGDLIERVQEKNGWSDRDLADRAGRMNLEIAKSNFSRLKNQPLNSIKGSLIKGLAEVLDISESRVAQAALASLGVDLGPADDSLDVAVRRSLDLSERDRRIINAVLTTMRTEERGGNVSTAPITRAGESPAPSNTDTTQDDVDLAAYETGQESQGRRLRRLQDEAAEGSQD
ncbi:hypothetical protein V6S67_08115 [Arthrobacter sp. Soc17.1.1.1]|uniref:hypothetical protein n=1 Tax=Arthrobacter sp. Soc17.1.1.1 TaxID=3121277 RepID=UPI002FE4DF5B